ncbi:hypothetical protein [Oleisolibacter albus]|uniref:hypothetical protein n=1 Tax=Oleisolibacter albus TaxID=2171757 RepID=UPI0012D837F4|nr:hypothetical protein [Oleisolibacter albus]
MLRSRLATATAIFALFCASAFAADAPAKKKAPPPKAKAAPCYTPAEFEAEQAIRLHTELMVVGLTCQAMDQKGTPSLFAQYKQFTLNHQMQIQEWEKALIGQYKRAGVKNPTKEFDSFRTRLANEMSQRAIALTTPIFCESHAAIVPQALAMSVADVKRAVTSEDVVRVSLLPRCDRPAQAVQVAQSAAVASPSVR